MKRIERENKVFIGATMMILLGFVLILTLPYILTRNHGWFDFTETGQIGDTIGGITAPFIAVCSAYITFRAFWVQYTYNKKQKNVVDFFEFAVKAIAMITSMKGFVLAGGNGTRLFPNHKRY